MSEKSIFAWVIKGGCHGGSYGNADASAGPVPRSPSGELGVSEGPKRMGLALPCALDGPCLIEIFGK